MIKSNYSVLMSVYAKENPEHLRVAMDSIWEQSVKTNNFVLVCDGLLTYELNDVIDDMENRYSNLTVVRLKKNVGLGNALNLGMKYCTNELIARMDSDDISVKNRCEEQICVFQKHPETSICSGMIEEFRDNVASIVGVRRVPEKNEAIRKFSRRRNPFNHPAVMFKKSAVLSVGGYSEQFHLFEDYYLWIRMLQKGLIGYNLQYTILYMRTSKEFYMRRGSLSYMIDVIKFHSWLLSLNWSSCIDFIISVFPHIIICILPNLMRESFYKKLHT